MHFRPAYSNLLLFVNCRVKKQHSLDYIVVSTGTGIDRPRSMSFLQSSRLGLADLPRRHIYLVTDDHHRNLLLSIVVYLSHPQLHRVE